MNFSVTLSLEELQVIVNALATRPFAEVHELITKIQSHVNGEIAKAQSAAAAIAETATDPTEESV
jgi:hypothetical protein